MEFKIKHNKWFLRWKNWKDFLLSKNISNNNIINDNVVLFVTYNNPKDTIKLINYFLKNEIKDSFDIVIVDNHSNKENFEKIKNFILKQKERKIILLQAIENLWWAWWYALWLEYILSKKYNYVVITEDDAIPLQDNTISKMLDLKPKEVVITYKEKNTTSFSLHFHWYPINLIKKVWVLDPRYFMRSDDLEWSLRIWKEIKQLKIETKYISSLYYSHPVIKKWANKLWQIYLWQRNSLFTESRWRFNYFSFIIIFLYIWMWFSKFFLEKDFRYIKYILLAYFDFIFIRFWYIRNKKILQKLFTEKDFFYKENNFKKISLEKFNNKYYNYYLLYTALSFLKWKINCSKKLFDWFKNWIIINWYNLPLYPLFSCFKKNISIEEITQNNEIIIYEKINNIYLTIPMVFISFILWTIVYVLILPIIIIRFILWRVFKI